MEARCHAKASMGLADGCRINMDVETGACLYIVVPGLQSIWHASVQHIQVFHGEGSSRSCGIQALSNTSVHKS